MLSSLQLRNYFPDLTNNYFTSGLALVHSRFSTNTFPTWGLAQPFRLLAHNGEINTIRGNRGWMEARESVLSSPALGDIKELRPIIQPNMSDSASLDNVLEFLVMSGLSLPHAMAMLVPESFNEKNPISEDLKAFYEYHSILIDLGTDLPHYSSATDAMRVVCWIATVCVPHATLLRTTTSW